MIDPQLIFKRLRSDRHPDDWEIHKKGNGTNPLDAKLRRAVNDARMAEMDRQPEQDQRKRAEAAATKERKAREKADAENAKLREQLSKAKDHAKAAPNPDECVDIRSGLLSRAAVAKLSSGQIGEKMQTLYGECDRGQHNVAALRWRP